MTMATRAGLKAVGAVGAIAVAVGVSACGSNTGGSATTASSASGTASSSSAPTSSSAAPSTSAQAAAPITTLADYIRDNNIVETPVRPGDPGSPTIDIPPPKGWEDMGSNTPEGAYSGLVFTGDPAMTNPPTVITKVFKLTGNVDPAKVLEAAPGEVRALPGFQGADSGQPSKLSGFDAAVIGGTYPKDGVTQMVAQKTVVIPGQDGLYVLQINANGTEDQAYPLMDATASIDEQAKITP